MANKTIEIAVETIRESGATSGFPCDPYHRQVSEEWRNTLHSGRDDMGKAAYNVDVALSERNLEDVRRAYADFANGCISTLENIPDECGSCPFRPSSAKK